MNRRALFGAAAATVLGVVPLAVAEEQPQLRAVYRYNYATGSWARVRMYELRKGDVFRLDDDPSARAYSDPEKMPNGRWSIQADFFIDPTTNSWVPA